MLKSKRSLNHQHVLHKKKNYWIHFYNFDFNTCFSVLLRFSSEERKILNDSFAYRVTEYDTWQITWRCNNKFKFSLFAFLVIKYNNFSRWQCMARWPLETARLIVEVTSYITIQIHQYCCSVRLSHFRNYFTKNSSSSFLKLGKLDKEVIWTGREFQIFGPW